MKSVSGRLTMILVLLSAANLAGCQLLAQRVPTMICPTPVLSQISETDQGMVIPDDDLAALLLYIECLESNQVN